MSLYHTPRMPAWSPPESLSGTPTSSACSLPRTPTDDAAPVPHPAAHHNQHHSLIGSSRPALVAKARDPSALAFAAQAKVLASRPVVVAHPPAAAAASSSASATPNTALPTAPLGLAPPFSHAPAASSSSLAPAGPRDASLSVLQPSTQQAALAPSAAEPRRPASDASSAPTHNTPSVPARAAAPGPGPGTPKANTASALGSASMNGAGGPAAGVPPPAGVSRKRRKRSTPEQIEVLERHFAINDRPTSTARESIAKEVEMTPRQVTIWMQNRRQMRKKRLLEASGQMSYRPGSPSSLGAHPSSDSVGSIPSSEMDDLPFTTVYGQRRVVNKENVRPIAAFRPAPVAPASAVETPASKASAAKTAASAPELPRRSPPLPRATRVASQRPSLPETPSGTSSAPFQRAASPTGLGHTASHPAPTLLDKCVQSRELPFVHQKRSRSSDGTGRATGLPIMGWRDQPPTEASTSGRDVWQHMMSDPPSGGLLELHEDESDGVDEPDEDEDDVKPAAKVRRTSSSSSAASSSRYLTVGSGGGGGRGSGGRHQASSLPPHLEQRPSLRRSASLDCAASRPPAGLLKRARTASKSAAPPDAREPSSSLPPARRRASRDRSAESSSKASSSSSSSSSGGGGAVGSNIVGGGAVKPDATDVECARLLMGLFGGA